MSRQQLLAARFRANQKQNQAQNEQQTEPNDLYISHGDCGGEALLNPDTPRACPYCGSQALLWVDALEARLYR